MDNQIKLSQEIIELFVSYCSNRFDKNEVAIRFHIVNNTVQPIVERENSPADFIQGKCGASYEEALLSLKEFILAQINEQCDCLNKEALILDKEINLLNIKYKNIRDIHNNKSKLHIKYSITTPEPEDKEM